MGLLIGKTCLYNRITNEAKRSTTKLVDERERYQMR